MSVFMYIYQNRLETDIELFNYYSDACEYLVKELVESDFGGFCLNYKDMKESINKYDTIMGPEYDLIESDSDEDNSYYGDDVLFNSYDDYVKFKVYVMNASNEDEYIQNFPYELINNEKMVEYINILLLEKYRDGCVEISIVEKTIR